MYEALRTTAAIIFAVVGAWMAIIYPDRLKLSFQPDFSKRSSAPPTGWGQLFTPVVNSTAILSVILVIGVVAPIAKKYHSPIDVQYMFGASYGLLVALTLWQLWTVVLTLVPADKVKSYLDQDDKRASYIESMTARGIRQDTKT